MLDTGILLIGVGTLLIIVGVIADCFKNKRDTRKKSVSKNRTEYRSTSSTEKASYTVPHEKYVIAQNEFEAIAYKCAYKVRRVEHVSVSANAVTITINSQRNLSNWSAKIYFELSGSSKWIGRYNIFSDNKQSNIPEMIAKQIRIEIFEHVGLL
ncbi:MAG: hypothetical protein J6K32_06465 [Clostridia bacterium]|nr:hypothetical protein [Clostridia bacterium]